MKLTSEQVESLMAWARERVPDIKLKYEFSYEDGPNEGIFSDSCKWPDRVIFRAYHYYDMEMWGGRASVLVLEKRLL